MDVTRSPALQDFVVAAMAAYQRQLTDEDGRRSIGRISALLETPGRPRTTPGAALAVTEAYLDKALAIAGRAPALSELVASLRPLASAIRWRRRPDVTGTASANFETSHANGMILGPDGIEERDDLWIGLSLLAPATRYPDHVHPPEETYLVLSEGEFRHGDSAWFRPGPGGTFYNTPGIDHAMKSADTPLLALWALRI